MVGSIERHFPTLFDQVDEESREERESEQGTDSGAGESNQGAAQTYGILPYVLTYCQLTNETITTAYASSVIHLFYVVSYETERRERENEQRKRYMQRGYSGMR